MNRCRRILGVVALIALWVPAPALAVKYSLFKNVDITGKVESRLTFRTQDSKGYTAPDVNAGDLVQHRNLAYVEAREKLSSALSYRLVGRAIYEGIYDYGDEKWQETRRQNRDEIDDFKTTAEIWEGYVDVKNGPVFLRVGRQNLSWGETDLFQLLDRINPLDNTFGGIFESQDDRRIPLWMGKGVLDLGDHGPLRSMFVEGFLNPGFWDQRVAPMTPAGTPYAFPAPPAGIPTTVLKPEKTMDDSRWGFRLAGVLPGDINFTVAHFKTYLDAPTARLVYDGSGALSHQELELPKVSITGGSFSFFEPLTSSVIRGEVAWHHDEPVFIPAENLGKGEVPEKDVLRFALGVDKPFWIRFLNPKAMINASFQYFGEWYPDFEDGMRVAAPKYPSGEFATIHRYEQKAVLSLSTNYMTSRLNPSVAAAWDPRGVVLLAPSVQYVTSGVPMRFTLAYNTIIGREDISFGFFEDRDQVSLNVAYLF